MEWFESEELSMVTGTIRDFCDREVSGKVFDLESLARPEFPRRAVDALAEMGFLWGPAPEELGGGIDDITSVVILTEIAYACAGLAAIVATNYAALKSIVSVPGGLGFLKTVLEGGRPGGGQPLLGVSIPLDVESLEGTGGKTTCCAIPDPGMCDLTLVFTGRGDGTGMAVAHGDALLQYSLKESGLPGCDEMPVRLLSIPGDALYGMQGVTSGPAATEAFGSLLSALKLYYSAVMLGAARSAAEYALNYAKERRQTGRAIIDHQNVRQKLVEMEVGNQAAASFLYRAACSGAAAGGFNLNDKLFAFAKSECEHVVNEAVQTLGGYGYMREYGLEKKLRDVKTLQVLVPTTMSDWLGTTYVR